MYNLQTEQAHLVVFNRPIFYMYLCDGHCTVMLYVVLILRKVGSICSPKIHCIHLVYIYMYLIFVCICIMFTYRCKYRGTHSLEGMLSDIWGLVGRESGACSKQFM